VVRTWSGAEKRRDGAQLQARRGLLLRDDVEVVVTFVDDVEVLLDLDVEVVEPARLVEVVEVVRVDVVDDVELDVDELLAVEEVDDVLGVVPAAGSRLPLMPAAGLLPVVDVPSFA
jgi:hypothetical protein